MEILNIEPVRKCLDGERVMDYQLNTIITTDSIYKMATLGKLEYYKTFPNRYFTVELPNGSFIRGFEGSHSIRVTYQGTDELHSKELVETLLNSV